MFAPQPTTEYAPTAYRPDGVKPMPEILQSLRKRSLEGQSYLPWGHYLGLESSRAVAMPRPEPWFLNSFSLLARVWRIDHRQIHYKLPNILVWLLYFALYGYVGTSIYSWLMSLPLQKSPVISVQGLTLLLIGGGVTILLLIPMVYFFSFPFRIILDWPTGMIIFRRFLRPALKVPFAEFDAKLTPPNKDSYLLNCYKGSLHARYHAFYRAFGIVRAGSAGSVYLYWQFLQRFMDVTQPLPDIPNLEPYRRFDPTTVAHDAKTNRPERVWRDKSKAEIETLVQHMREKEERIEPVWPCALARFIKGRDPMSAEIARPT